MTNASQHGLLASRRALTLGLLSFVAVIALASCGGDDGGGGNGGGDTSPTPVSGTPSPENCEPNVGLTMGELTWFEIFPLQLFEQDEWRVLAGRGEGPFVSVSKDREVVGAIELLQFPHESDFDPAEGIAALNDWAAGYYAGVETDRTTVTPTYVFEPREPEPVNVGALCGISYGFTGMVDGEEIDRLAGFATYDQSNLYLLVAQYDAAQAEELGFRSAALLEEFEPVFADFIDVLGFPPGAAVTPSPEPEATAEPTAP